MPAQTNKTHVRVTYADTDRMGHAYYANYLVWFEVGRTEILRAMGRSYKQWEDEKGIFLPVASCSVEYRKAAKYDDLLRVETTIAEVSRASITFEYRILNDATNELLATGSSRHPFLNGVGRVVRVGHELLPELFRA